MRSSRKYEIAPEMVNTTSDRTRTRTLPNLSANAPMPKPTNAMMSEGRVMIRETRKSCPGKTSLINGRAGATAAPPINMSMEHNRIDIIVRTVGLNPSPNRQHLGWMCV